MVEVDPLRDGERGDDVVAVVDKAEQFAAKMTLRFGSSHQK